MTTGTTPAPQLVPAGSLGGGTVFQICLGGAGSAKGQYLSASYGTFTANGATPVTVADVNATATSIILFGLVTVGGTVGAVPSVKTQTAGTGFTVGCTASDTSIYGYLILG